MKTRPFVRPLLAALLLLAVGSSLSAQGRRQRQEQKKEAVRQAIASKEYTINVDRALPMGGSSISLTSSFSLRIKNDSVFSYLPYYGRAYSVPYGGGKALNFNAPIQEYSLTTNRKGTATIRFRATTDEDSYDFRAQVFDNGSASIDVTMRNRQAIHFQGELADDNRR
ncbi:MAG: DUF4251 domain-containing protein [Mediterranea sp.]|jgi:hypothetical protein|nr:DUF4251 domain-containing protein [Mediterranea sp.]